MTEKTKGILLAALIAVAAFVWYLERRSDSVAVSASQSGDLNYRPLGGGKPRVAA